MLLASLFSRDCASTLVYHIDIEKCSVFSCAVNTDRKVREKDQAIVWPVVVLAILSLHLFLGSNHFCESPCLSWYTSETRY